MNGVSLLTLVCWLLLFDMTRDPGHIHPFQVVPSKIEEPGLGAKA